MPLLCPWYRYWSHWSSRVLTGPHRLHSSRVSTFSDKIYKFYKFYKIYETSSNPRVVSLVWTRNNIKLMTKPGRDREARPVIRAGFDENGVDPPRGVIHLEVDLSFWQFGQKPAATGRTVRDAGTCRHVPARAVPVQPRSHFTVLFGKTGNLRHF